MKHWEGDDTSGGRGDGGGEGEGDDTRRGWGDGGEGEGDDTRGCGGDSGGEVDTRGDRGDSGGGLIHACSLYCSPPCGVMAKITWPDDFFCAGLYACLLATPGSFSLPVS